MDKKKVLDITGRYIAESVHSKNHLIKKGNYYSQLRDEETGVDVFTYVEDKTFIIMCLASNEDIDWATNFNFFRIKQFFSRKLYPYGNPCDTKVRMHGKYALGYMAVRDKLKTDFMTSGCDEVCCVGYSMGGGIAPIIALDLQYRFGLHDDKVGCGFDGPKVFNKAGQISYNKRVPLTYRFMYGNDMVSKVPPAIFDFFHVGEYTHVGEKEVWWKLSAKDHTAYKVIADKAWSMSLA